MLTVKSSPLKPPTGLYLITDPRFLPNEQQLLTKVELALQGGVQLLQYRNKLSLCETHLLKEATLLKQLCDAYQVPFIINDHLALAIKLQCGLHLGQSDGSITQARSELGKDAIIGATCHNSLALAENAINEGANYIAFGSLFPSTSKPEAQLASLDTLKTAKQRWPLVKVVGIGGINHNNCRTARKSGADMVAVINAIWDTDNPLAATQQFNLELTR